MSKAIQTAELDWQCIDGIEIPVSKAFGDVYFSKDNGLLETRHVFLNGNNLSTRLSELSNYEYFSVGETGFGTGLNILALWQLWQQVRPDNHSHLHAISVEKFPLTRSDLIRALKAWPELGTLAQQLIDQYPQAIAGCHRLNFPNERFSLDLWLGDAHDVFPSMAKTRPVNAWFLDGFAPSCNPDIWEQQVLNNIVRLSEYNTTFASFSVAGVLKRGLKQHGIDIQRTRGFGHKREMLKAQWLAPSSDPQTDLCHSETDAISEKKSLNHPHEPALVQMSTQVFKQPVHKQRHIAIIGAGIAGLSCAWGLAQRGHKVTVYDKSAPLAGASGNPLALLNPKLCPIEHSSEHLMTLAWQHALQHYRQFHAFRAIQVQQLALKNPEDLLSLSTQYPQDILTKVSTATLFPSTVFDSLKLNDAGVVAPHQLRDQILQHPLIEFIQAEIIQIEQPDEIHKQVQLSDPMGVIATFDHAIVCSAQHSAQFFSEYPQLKPIRGQVSWVNNTEHPLPLDQAYSYGGYCMQLNANQLILGASFYPNRDDDEVQREDHVHNRNLIHSVFPEYATQLPDLATWQGRASVRAQTLDYFPLLGQVHPQKEIYTFAGLGSKGFLFAPLCTEILMAQMLGEACPVSKSLLQKLSPQRFNKKVKVKKPYYQAPH